MNTFQMKRMGKKRKRIIIAAAVILLAVIVVDFAATELIYSSVFARYDEPADCPDDVTEALDAAGYEELCFLSGTSRIAARLYRPRAETQDKDALILLIPGVHAGMDDHLPLILELIRLGYGVVCFDPTGCRESEGKNAGGFLQTVYDTEACLALIEENEFFGFGHLFMIGHSRGGYAACHALANNADAEAAVVLSVPDSAMDAVMGSTVQAVGKPAAYANYPMLWFTQALLYGPGNLAKRASEYVDESGKPVLIVLGEDDPYYTSESYSLYSRRGDIKNPAAVFLTLPGGHGELIYDASGHASEALIDAVDSFFAECLTAGRSE